MEYFSPPPLILRQSSSPVKTPTKSISDSYILSPPLPPQSIRETTPTKIETIPINPDMTDGPRGGQVANDPSKSKAQSKRQTAPLYGEIVVLG